MSYEYSDKLDSIAKERYLAKLKACSLNECPYKLPGGSWQNNPLQWPDVQFPDIYCYLIETPGVYTHEAMKNYKSLDAHNYFLSGWVQTVYHIKVQGSTNVLFKANVRPSQRMNDPPHNPWVVCAKAGKIIGAHCDCMAGLGESCSHVAALMFKIEAAVRQGYTKQACTDVPCKWNECFVKKVQPAEISKIKFYKDSAKQRFRRCQNETEQCSFSTEDEKQQILQRLSRAAAKPIVLGTYGEYCGPFKRQTEPKRKLTLPVDMRSLYESSTSNWQDVKDKALDAIKVTEEQISNLQSMTVSQASNPIWHQMRLGRITASNAHSLLHTNKQKPALSLMKGVCTPQMSISAPAIQWGKEKEPEALKVFQESYSKFHNPVTVTTTGMRISKDFPFLGASPDGIVSCCCGTGVIEIKCPFKYKDGFPDNMHQHANCCLTEESTLKKEHAYYTQVQLQMFIFGVNFAWFVYWTPQDTIICRVTRDEAFIESMLDSLSKLWFDHILPELLTRNIENHASITESQTKETEKVCSYCKESKEGKLIMCDNPTCQKKWFHLTCLKRKTVPRKMWFCKDCKKEQKSSKTL